MGEVNNGDDERNVIFEFSVVIGFFSSSGTMEEMRKWDIYHLFTLDEWT